MNRPKENENTLTEKEVKTLADTNKTMVKVRESLEAQANRDIPVDVNMNKTQIISAFVKSLAQEFPREDAEEIIFKVCARPSIQGDDLTHGLEAQKKKAA